MMIKYDHLELSMTSENLLFRQLFEHESSTFTYILADKKTKEAVIIDPVIETLNRDLNLIQELELNLKYIIDTHVHADHVTSAGRIREKTNAKSIAGKDSQVECIDIPLEDGGEVQFGEFTIKAISTPGHTNGCTSFLIDDMVFTGDALLIRGNGRTDFQEGSAEVLYDSITKRLYSLPDTTRVFPAHNYEGIHESTIGEEKQFNHRIAVGRSKEEFVKIMNNLNLPKPQKIDISVPANKNCGIEPTPQG